MAVDWSANGKPKQGKDSIWIAIQGVAETEELDNPATRQEAMGRIECLLEQATAAGRRLLVGFDFPFGYPAGTARMLAGRDGWETVWSRVAEVIEDGPRNANNRFDAAASLNAAFEGEGPFWGNGLQRDIPGLPRKKPPSGWGENLPTNLRHAEFEVKGAQEVWKLNGAGSVGGQALTGIAALEGLRDRASVHVWPFETLGEGRSHVLAEIYPSLIEPKPGHEVKDARQVDAVAAALQKLDELGELERHLRAPSRMPPAVREEEGLILGMQDPTGFQRAATLVSSGRRRRTGLRGRGGVQSGARGGGLTKGTTEPGYKNRNNQTVIRKTNKSGTDHGQMVYELRCGDCGRSHGANGSDIFQRRCPHCDPKSTGEDLLLAGMPGVGTLS